MKFQGYGYQFDTKYVGGPADGLESSCIQLESSNPPRFLWVDVKNIPEEKPLLGEQMIKQWSNKKIPAGMKVAVYEIDGEPENHSDEEVVCYRYKTTTTYAEYIKEFQGKTK